MRRKDGEILDNKLISRVIFLVDEYPRLGGTEVVTDRMAQEIARKGIPVEVLARTKGVGFSASLPYKIRIWSPLSYAMKRSAVSGVSKSMIPFALLLILCRKIKILPYLVSVSEKVIIRGFLRGLKREDVIISTRADILDMILKAAGQNLKSRLKDPLVVNQFHTSLSPLGEYGAFLPETQKNIHFIDGFTVLSERCKNSKIKSWGIPTIFLPNPNPVYTSKKLRHFQKKIVVAARFVESKQIDKAIEVFEKFISDPEYKEWSLDIFGAGELQDDIKKLIRSKDLEGKISLRGQAETPEEIFSSAGIHLMTSRFEGWSLVSQEAGCFGVPTIAFDVSGGTRYLVESLSGYVVPLNDMKSLLTFLKYLADKSKSDDYAISIRDASLLFDVGIIVDNFLSWLKKMQKSR